MQFQIPLYYKNHSTEYIRTYYKQMKRAPTKSSAHRRTLEGRRSRKHDGLAGAVALARRNRRNTGPTHSFTGLVLYRQGGKRHGPQAQLTRARRSDEPPTNNASLADYGLQ